MKNIYFIIAILSVNVLIAQTNKTDGNGSNISNALVLSASGNNGSINGASTYFFAPDRKTEGSVHLFKNWNNFAIIYTQDNQKFSLKNINVNIENNTFESKIGQDSLFTFNFNNINKFVINNKVFKNLYYNNINRIFEMIYESNEFSILKGYRVQLIEGSANPMVNRKNSRLVQKSYYYIMRGKSISPFKLSKKKILGLFEGSNQERVKKIEKYAKDNNLSYKKAYDVQRMLTFSLIN